MTLNAYSVFHCQRMLIPSALNLILYLQLLMQPTPSLLTAICQGQFSLQSGLFILTSSEPATIDHKLISLTYVNKTLHNSSFFSLFF